MSIERTPDAKGSRLYRASTPIDHWQISAVIDGRSIAEAYTKRQLPRDFSIRHQQHPSCYRRQSHRVVVSSGTGRIIVPGGVELEFWYRLKSDLYFAIFEAFKDDSFRRATPPSGSSPAIYPERLAKKIDCASS
jgi:hypothetical protein